MKVCVILADGFETVEALAVIDVLRRAGVDTVTVSITGSKNVVSSHNITVQADAVYEEVQSRILEAQVLFLPGGMPGTLHIKEHEGVINAVRHFNENGKIIAAICAAPGRILGELGLLKGRRATCHASVVSCLEGAFFVDEPVVTDGNIITSRGMGTAVQLGLELVRRLVDEETAEKIAKAIHLI